MHARPCFSAKANASSCLSRIYCPVWDIFGQAALESSADICWLTLSYIDIYIYVYLLLHDSELNWTYASAQYPALPQSQKHNLFRWWLFHDFFNHAKPQNMIFNVQSELNGSTQTQSSQSTSEIVILWVQLPNCPQVSKVPEAVANPLLLFSYLCKAERLH